jgi:hypothetical protein
MKTMRVLFVVILMTTCGAYTAHAQAANSQSSQQSAKEKIKKEDLPAAAIKVLDSNEYKGWMVVQVYRMKVKDAQGKETSDYEYEVELKKDEITQALKFDKNGNTKQI